MKAEKSSWLLILALFILPYCPATALSQTGTGQPEAQMVEVQGHKMHVRVAGLESRQPGRPIVVFENGLGATLECWDAVYPLVARLAPVIAYDRAGVGQSDEDGETPTPQHSAERLHVLLAQIQAKPPYVLVGHSFGGPLIRMFTGLYPEEVTGLVYVDPADFTITKAENQAMYEAAGAGEEGRKAFEELSEKSFREARPAAQAESRVAIGLIATSFAEFRNIKPVPDIPIVTLMALKYEWEAIARKAQLPFDVHKLFEAWIRLRLDKLPRLTREVSEGTFVMTSDSGHFIQLHEPDLVVWAIERVLFPDIGRQIRRAIDKDGPAAGLEAYSRLKRSYPADRFQESLLNTLGSDFFRQGRFADAVAIFELNVGEYPSAWRPYYGLANGYKELGNREKAITCLRKSLELNPQNKSAADMLKKLEMK
jgi:pimeloyl-ACP methyl ester carboxylesterase